MDGSAVCLGSAAGEIALVAAGISGSVTAIMLAGVLFGVFALTLYSVCVAHMNDHGQSESFVSISGGLLVVYSVGAIVGPTAASLGVGSFGISSIFVFPAVVHLLFAGYTAYRIVSTPALTEEQRSDFVAVPFPQVTPLPTELDPRAADEEPPLEETGGPADEPASEHTSP